MKSAGRLVEPTYRGRVPRYRGLAGLDEAVQDHELVNVGLLLLEREVLQSPAAELVGVELDQAEVLQQLVWVP